MAQDGLVGLLSPIAGVERITIMPYFADIQLSPAFEWDEIEPAILDVLSAFGKEEPADAKPE